MLFKKLILILVYAELTMPAWHGDCALVQKTQRMLLLLIFELLGRSDRFMQDQK
jgi:hypothetical protein